MKKIFVAAILLLLLKNVVFAQINESDTTRFQLRANVTGNYQQGNVTVTTIKSRLDFSYAPVKDWVLKSQNSSLYQSFYKKKADNDLFSRNYFYYKPYKRLYPFAIAYVSTNYRRKIDLRYFAGMGVTYQLLQQQKNVLKLSASAVYEATTFTQGSFNYPEYNGSDKISLWRATVYVAGWNYLLQNHLRLYYDAYWQPAFNNSNNYRTQFDVGLDFPVWKGLSINALYSFTHENVVVTNIQQEDKILTFGLAYNLKIKQQ